MLTFLVFLHAIPNPGWVESQPVLDTHPAAKLAFQESCSFCLITIKLQFPVCLRLFFLHQSVSEAELDGCA
jgi:hypothetical protein